ncbi:hypothetical protein RHMOL_Rhmol06G0167800 [Rhododendron molle]|uniref:Uncharacterized protein n=1 Tax=Rhododendron molle TaxID=49168 RepID=A0ACC0NDQ5_RHOML|nr:hypothetical protein RHMOL_Rhmol06G0167800 [Rhododendron molle]
MGEVRFPLHQFVRWVLRTLSLTSSQLTVNSYQIITIIIELRRQYNLTFRLEELFRVYLVGINRKNARYYLSCRTRYDTFLIDRLPNSEEWVSIYVSVSENFMLRPGESIDTATMVQLGTGTPADGVVQELRERAIRARVLDGFEFQGTRKIPVQMESDADDLYMCEPPLLFHGKAEVGSRCRWCLKRVRGWCCNSKANDNRDAHVENDQGLEVDADSSFELFCDSEELADEDNYDYDDYVDEYL